jgi:hypothetical protein
MGIRRTFTSLAHCASLALLAACATPWQSGALVVGGTGVLGHSPTSIMNQTYYLGAFDPLEQMPPTIYRIRVQGQASALSRTAFASGWVRADLVDSLSGKIEVDRNTVQVSGNKTVPLGQTDENGTDLNRRLIMFGPEGFREAPRNHRLVVVMGSNPESFFSSVDRALGVVAGATQSDASGPDVKRELWADLSRMREERRAMQTMIDLAGKE